MEEQERKKTEIARKIRERIAQESADLTEELRLKDEEYKRRLEENERTRQHQAKTIEDDVRFGMEMTSSEEQQREEQRKRYLENQEKFREQRAQEQADMLAKTGNQDEKDVAVGSTYDHDSVWRRAQEERDRKFAQQQKEMEEEELRRQEKYRQMLAEQQAKKAEQARSIRGNVVNSVNLDE